MRYFLFLLTFQACANLFSGVENYFKIPTKIPPNPQIEGIDFIYVINLDQRPSKFEETQSQLISYSIDPYRFSAVNGWELSHHDLNQLGFIPNKSEQTPLMGTTYPTSDFSAHHEKIGKKEVCYFSHCMSRGAIGIVLSHCSVLAHALENIIKLSGSWRMIST